MNAPSYPLALVVVASNRSKVEQDRLDAIARLKSLRTPWWWLTVPLWERRTTRHALAVLEGKR